MSEDINEVLAAMAERARELGWVVVEWDALELSDDGTEMFRLWLRPVDEGARR